MKHQRHLSPLTLLLLAVVAAAACSTSPERPSPAASNQPPKGGAPASSGSPSGSDDAQRVSFTTADDASIVIAGDLYLPDKSPAPAIIALHQWKSDRSAWKPFATVMRNAGFVVLAIDGRGFGESTQGAQGTVEPSWQTAEDIAAAIEYLKLQPIVDSRRIGLAGASYGASNALIFAAAHPENIRATALLSVGANYHDELPTEPAIRRYGDRPLMMIAARDDQASAADTEKLSAVARNPQYSTKIYDSGGHGTALLAAPASAVDTLKAFFEKSLSSAVEEGPTKAGGDDAESSTGSAPEAPVKNSQ